MRWRVVWSAMAVATLLGGPAQAGDAGWLAGARPEPRFVREVQRVLRDLGYRPGPIDGTVGPRTQAALTRYQRAEGIAETGYLDAETMVRLDIHERVFGVGNASGGLRAAR
jgi:hypothetical protein